MALHRSDGTGRSEGRAWANLPMISVETVWTLLQRVTALEETVRNLESQHLAHRRNGMIHIDVPRETERGPRDADPTLW